MNGKKNNDGMPAFLRRERTPETTALIDRIIRQDDRPAWVMPTVNRTGVQVMARKPAEINCEDPELPVEVSFAQANGQTVTKEFGDMNEFGSWFDPKLHEVYTSEAGDGATLIGIREKEPKKSKAKPDKPPPEQPKAAPKKAAVKAPAVSRGVVVKEAEVRENVRAAKGKPASKTKTAAKAKTGRNVRHGVRVNGKDYRSAWDAFTQLKLGTVSECVTFRTLLKASKSGKETYTKGKTKYPFERIDK